MAEARDTGERVRMSDADVAARKRRSTWTALALFAFVIIIFAVTVANLGPENLRQ